MSLNFNEFQQLLQEQVQNLGIETLITPIRAVIRCLAPHKTEMFFGQAPIEKKIYHFSQLAQLTTRLNAKDNRIVDQIDYQEKYHARYLVTSDLDMYFAEEGAPDAIIPGHREINFCCLAAGNVIFSEDYSCITGVNNESGDFKPSMASIIWALIRIVDLNLTISNQMNISLYSPEGQIIEVEISADEVRELVNSELANLLKDSLAALPKQGDFDSPRR